MEPNTSGSSKATIWILVAILVIVAIAAAVVLMQPSSDNTANPANETPTQTPTETATTTPTAPAGSSGGASVGGSVSAGVSVPTTRSFTVTASNFKFSLSEIKVKKGDTVKITVKNSAGFHDLVIDEYSVRTKQLQAGQEETIQFVASKAGTFEYYCSVGTHRQMGMVGKLIVE